VPRRRQPVEKVDVEPLDGLKSSENAPESAVLVPNRGSETGVKEFFNTLACSRKAALTLPMRSKCNASLSVSAKVGQEPEVGVGLVWRLCVRALLTELPARCVLGSSDSHLHPASHPGLVGLVLLAEGAFQVTLLAPDHLALDHIEHQR
jgi:hypothetical protein